MILAAHQSYDKSGGWINSICEYCKNPIRVRPYLVKKGMGKFCGVKCYGLSRREKFDYLLLVETFGKRTCRLCFEEKDLNQFSPDNRTRKRTTICKSCKCGYERERRIKNPNSFRESDLKKSYGIDLEKYNEILASQNGVCAICLKPETSKRGWLHVAHCHRTREVRGLLCGNCNTGIGKFGDDSKVMQSAIEYLRRVQG